MKVIKYLVQSPKRGGSACAVKLHKTPYRKNLESIAFETYFKIMSTLLQISEWSCLVAVDQRTYHITITT